jgi:hypothetical protein
MRNTITGKVSDNLGTTLPGAMVYISDSTGRLANEKARVKTDSEGNFVLPATFPFPNPLTGKLQMTQIGTHLTVKYSGLVDSTTPIDFSTSQPMNVTVFPKTQDIQEVTVTSGPISQAEQDCIAKGGKYTRARRDANGNLIPGSCALPQPEKPKTWWEKNKVAVIIAGITLVAAGTLLIIATRKKD